MRFFWFRDNDPNKDLIEWSSCVHLQGLKGSPAIADVGRRFASKNVRPSLSQFQREMEKLVSSTTTDRVDLVLSDNFYVDDLLGSEKSPEDAVNVLQEARSRLSRYNINLCKIQSNHNQILAETTGSSTLPSIVEFSSSGIHLPKKRMQNLKIPGL